MRVILAHGGHTNLLRSGPSVPHPHFRTFVESPIGFVGRDNQGGLENARARTRAASFEKKGTGEAENTTRILLFRGLYTVRIA